jgi:hypothetical protein
MVERFIFFQREGQHEMVERSTLFLYSNMIREKHVK